MCVCVCVVCVCAAEAAEERRPSGSGADELIWSGVRQTVASFYSAPPLPSKGGGGPVEAMKYLFNGKEKKEKEK